MTRFGNLEFDEESGIANETLSKSADIRDEYHYIKLAETEYQSARFEKALRFYSRALEYNPNLETAWVGQVRMLVELGEFKEADLWADKALELFREQPDLLATKSVVRVRLGDRDKALDFSDSAMRQKQPSTYVWLARGEVLLATKGRNADHCLEKAKTLAPRDWFNCLLIARIYYFYRKYAKALDYARQALDLHATSAFVWHVLGSCQFELGMKKQARSSYEQALIIDRDFDLARAALHHSSTVSFLGLLFSPMRWLLSLRHRS